MNGSDSLFCDGFHSTVETLHRVLFFGVVGVKVTLEMGVTHFVSWFELAILFAIALYCIVCQVDKDVVDVICVVILRTRPDITFVVPEILCCLTDCHHEDINTDIELPFLIEK